MEEEEGAFGLWVTYIVTALGKPLPVQCMGCMSVGYVNEGRHVCKIVLGTGASLASFFLLPTSSISMGASGAVFGLFAVSILTRLRKLNVRLLLEGAILGNFVVQQVLQVTANLLTSGLYNWEDGVV